jgi:leucyl/phenylalanyl-tRNA--protein transferase
VEVGEALPIPGPSRWRFPDPATAGEDGLVGIGADLEPATLLDAYRQGIFPWPHPGAPLPWFSPDPRGVIPLDGLKVSRSLRARLRRSGWETTVDRAFAAVLAACADRPPEGRGSGGLKPSPPEGQGSGGLKPSPPEGEGETWITAPMQAAYQRLHDLGHAHSLEVWAGGELVGGLYGVGVGAVFTGESMFHLASDASKAALVDLVARLAEAGGRLIDVQMVTPHLASLGARDLPRSDFLELLARVRDRPVSLATERLPVARLV